MRYFDSYWLTAEDLGLGSIWDEEWNDYIFALKKDGIILRDTEDEMVWSLNHSTCQVSPKDAYSKFSNYVLHTISK